MTVNINKNKFNLILKLGEFKNILDLYRNVDVKVGVVNRAYSQSDVVWKSQITTATKNKKIESLQKEINDITDELDEFNAITDITI